MSHALPHIRRPSRAAPASDRLRRLSLLSWVTGLIRRRADRLKFEELARNPHIARDIGLDVPPRLSDLEEDIARRLRAMW